MGEGLTVVSDELERRLLENNFTRHEIADIGLLIQAGRLNISWIQSTLTQYATTRRPINNRGKSVVMEQVRSNDGLLKMLKTNHN